MSQVVINFGTGGTSLNGQLGSTASPDSNDPKYLEWPGDNGNYVYVPGALGRNISVPDEAVLDITGDIDLRAYVALDDYTPSSVNTGILIAKAVSGQISYLLRIINTGAINFTFTTNGTTSISTNSTVATGLIDGTDKWIRATLDVDNGSSQKEVKFFTSDDGSTWTQLGTTVTTAGTTSIHSGTALVVFGGSQLGGTTATGKLYRAQVFDGIDGTKVLDIDTSVITSGSQATFIALTGQTATINRGTSSTKSVNVVSPVWLFGTDDFIEVADNSLIDFDNTQSFSLVAVYRHWANFGTNDTLIAKKADTTNTTQGYYLGSGASTAAQTQGQVGDGAAGATATQTTSRTSGDVFVSTLVRNVAADTITTFLNTTPGSAVTDATTLTSANTEAFRIGRLSGAGSEFADMELVSVAVFRRALSATEIGRIVAYYQARLT